jgi:hypothetical protein
MHSQNGRVQAPGPACRQCSLSHSLAHDPKGVLVEAAGDAERRVDSDGVNGVHGADVVQHVAVLEHNAAEEDEEIEAPHHLAEPAATPMHRLLERLCSDGSCAGGQVGSRGVQGSAVKHQSGKPVTEQASSGRRPECHR